MVEMRSDRVAPWLAGNGPDASVAVCCQCSVLRNLADWAFPDRCSNDELKAVEQRILEALRRHGLLDTGQYFSLADHDLVDTLRLAEWRLIPAGLLSRFSRGGLYVAEDFVFSIGVNGSDHVCMTANGSGLQLEELWNRLANLDDMLAGSFDYAFDEYFGYLTTSLSHVGTGLKASVLLHLPALTVTNETSRLAQSIQKRRHALFGICAIAHNTGPAPGFSSTTGPKEGTPLESPPLEPPACSGAAFYYDLTGALYCDVSQTQGDLYVLTNQSTLGLSEDEILFHLRQTADDVIAREKSARRNLLNTDPRWIEDRVARALGLARSVRLLELPEAVSLLSSIRLGLDAGLVHGYTLERLNELLFASQSAHIQAAARRNCDDRTLSIERADLFRARFSQN